MLLVKEQSARPVHVFFRTPPITDRYHDPSLDRLQLPSPHVIPQPRNSPEQQRRGHNMKQAQQPDRQRQGGIEHIFRAANQMPMSQQSAQQINREQSLKDQQPASLPRKNQRRLQPKPHPNQNISQITEEKKVLRTILMPTQRSPNRQPHRPSNFQPERNPHASIVAAVRRTFPSNSPVET